MVSTKKNKFLENFLKNLLAWCASALVLVPLALIILNAFKGDGEALTMTMELPRTWQWSNFATVIEKGKLLRSFLNSLLYAGCATILTVSLSSMAAYIFSRRRSRGIGFLYMYVVLGMVIPVNYVTLTKIMQMTHLNNTAIGIILLYTALQIPANQFVIRLGTAKLTTYAHKNNIAVQYWTINDADDIRMLRDINADCVMSDVPDLAYGVLHAE